jgi:flagellar assembly protein FliH
MLRPFQFERDFDAAAPAPEPVRKPPAKSAAETLAEQQEAVRNQAMARARAEFEQKLENARQKALEEGYAKGLAEGRAAAEQELAGDTHRLAQQLSDALPALRSAMHQQATQLAAEAGAFVAQVVAKLLPGLEADLAGLRLERFLAEALRAAPKAASILVRVSPASAERARAALDRLGLVAEAPSAIEIRPDPELSTGAAQVTWAQGGIALSPARVANAVLDACRTLAGPAPVLDVKKPRGRRGRPTPPSLEALPT